MALPALKLEPETLVEERLARMEERFGRVDRRFDEFEVKMEKGFAELKLARVRDRIWWLLMCGALLGVMAKGFHWL